MDSFKKHQCSGKTSRYQNNENKVTEDEIKAIVNEGYNGGEVQEMERDIVERVFHLDDLSASSVMTHRNNLEWIDINDDLATILAHTAKPCSASTLSVTALSTILLE